MVKGYDGSQFQSVGSNAFGGSAFQDVAVNGFDGSGWTRLDQAAIPDSGVARYKFEQDATDSWNGNDGTLTGGTYTTDSEIGSYAVSLDGADDAVDIPVSHSSGDGLSLSAWVKLSSPSSAQYIVTIDAPSQYSADAVLYIDDTKIGFQCYDGSYVSTNTSFSYDNTWTHIVGTKTASGDMEFYVNGSSVATATIGNLTESGTSSIGRRGGSGYLNGLVDDVRIYRKGLTDTEVSNLYNTGSI
ncbi:LamG domain-containing protein [Natrinema sp. DC36]|uniref:LamG domain-containing protein n=1 Tax=Natrinema sp. DC36 TaxID=2878680 RepID=UPI001CEFE528|nr:LamG domain-containing protein [Natrinema sp. DC36]